jgi:hypothetical protein
MSRQSPSRDYKAGGAPYESAPGTPPVEDFLNRLARAVRCYHTYPPTSPLCAEAIASCHAALAALDRSDQLAFRVTPRELVIDEVAVGGGTIIEHELVRRLHRGRVATIEIDRAASPRDLTHLCDSLIKRDGRGEETTLADLLVEHGVETIAARMAPRPEVMNLGVPAAPLRDLVDQNHRRRPAPPPGGPVEYLYPPEKGWIRLDPAADLDSVSLVDLAVLVNDPGEMATMLLRLTDDDPVGAVTPDQALEQKFGDVAMLFGALDPHLARVMFAKLAQAVLAIDADRRAALLRRTILPGLLDGRADGAVLRDFPDPDLAESLCLLLELETAAPEVVSAALHKLDLPAGRRETVASLVDRRLRGGAAAAAPSREALDRAGDRYARRLIQVEATPGTSFAEFAAFDLSMDSRTKETIVYVRDEIARSDTTLAQLHCLQHLVRLEPNPTVVTAFIARTLVLLAELAGAARWRDVADAATRFREITRELKESRPDIVDVVEDGLAEYWTSARVLMLVELEQRGEEGRALVRELLTAFGVSIVPGFLAVVGDPSLQSAAAPIVALMCEHGVTLAPGLVKALGRERTLAARAIVRVLGYAGAGYEAILGEQLTSDDEPLVRASLRSLARIGTARGAALVASQIQNGTAAARAAEEALWHFPQAEGMVQLRALLGRREFIFQKPDVAARLMDRAAQWNTGDLDGVLQQLETLRFRVWKPDLVRVARKARGLRAR